MIAWLHTCYVIINTNNSRSRGCSILLALSARRCHVINPGRFLTGGLPPERREGKGVVPTAENLWIEVWYQWKIIRYQRCRCYFWGQVRKQYSKEGIWRHYDYSEKFFGCKQQSNWVVTLMGNEGKNKNELKVVINNGDSAMGPFCLDTNELAMLRWLGKSMRTVKIKINENA